MSKVCGVTRIFVPGFHKNIKTRNVKKFEGNVKNWGQVKKIREASILCISVR